MGGNRKVITTVLLSFYCLTLFLYVPKIQKKHRIKNLWCLLSHNKKNSIISNKTSRIVACSFLFKKDQKEWREAKWGK
jgi:hypothetical protein